MIVGISVTEPEQKQAEALLGLIAQLGGFGRHKFILALEAAVSIDLGALPNKPDLVLRFTDFFHSFPQTDNEAWKTLMTQMQYVEKRPFLYLTAPAVPTCPGWIDFIEEAYLKCGKPLMGPLVGWTGINTMGPIGVYPGTNVGLALTTALNASTVIWPVQGAASIEVNLAPTNLIQHDSDQHGLANGVVLYYPDKDGSVMGAVIDRHMTDVALAPKEKVEREHDSEERIAARAALPVFHPWKSKHQSIERIKQLCAELKTYCDAPVHIAKVRDELRYAGVVKKLTLRKRRVVTVEPENGSQEE